MKTELNILEYVTSCVQHSLQLRAAVYALPVPSEVQPEEVKPLVERVDKLQEAVVAVTKVVNLTYQYITSGLQLGIMSDKSYYELREDCVTIRKQMGSLRVYLANMSKAYLAVTGAKV